MPIIVEQLSKRQQEALRISDWPIWECPPSTFDWHYDQEESCLLLTGEVVVTTAEQEVRFGTGDYVTFPRGLDCVWRVEKAVRKHYTFR